MIQASELRIGNWINQEDFPQKVLSVSTTAIVVEAIPLNWELKPEVFDPIPLTPELLEKCGFRIINYDIASALAKWKGLEIEIVLGYWYFRIGGTTWQVECKYLHQLQNIYFALTGQELEVQL